MWKLLLTLSAIRCVMSETLTIYVSPQKGQDSESCLTGGGVTNACATLGYAVSQSSDFTKVVLANMVHTVNATITITDVNGLTLTGTSSNSIVHCLQDANAGLNFVRISNLIMSRIEFQNCGSLSQSTSRVNQTTMALFRVAVYVMNTTNASFESTNFVNNRGVGLALFDVDGYVSVLDSNFRGNSVPEEEKLVYNGGGGLYIEHTYCTPGLLDCDYQRNPYSNDSVYSISRCSFVNNHGTTPPQHSSSNFVYQQKTTSRHFGAGGGLLIVIKGSSCGNRITITECKFERNSAGFGGASLINLQDFVQENVINFANCTVVNNHADFGGGGIAAGILFYELDSIFANKIHFHKTNFTNNSSPTGGGSYFFIGRTQSSELIPNSIHFSSCYWYHNNGTLGAALLLSPDAFNTLTDGYLPVPVFEDCVFEGNQITSPEMGNNIKQPAVGALFSSTFTINVTSNVTFIENDGTAISITAGSINVLKNATLEFINNTGTFGGALALLEFASLRLFPGSRVNFIDNYATEAGGAIFAVSNDETDFFFSRSCFIHYVDVTIPARDWDAHVEFVNNQAGPISNTKDTFGQTQGEYAWGNSFFSVTVLPCIQASDTTGDESINNAFPHDVGDTFSFNESCHDDLCGIATAPAKLQINPDQLDSDGVLRLSPGENCNLSLIAKDDLNNTVSAVVTASVFPLEVASVDAASLYITDSMVQINGKQNSNFTLTLHTIGRRQISTTVKAMFIECPPGFVYQGQKQKCECSASNHTTEYLGITRCSGESFRSLLNKGYWAGCDENTLLTAVCPPGYCQYDDDTSNPFYTLPQTCEELEKDICSPRNRAGRLCGECANDYTVFFHSEQYNCKQCNYGYLGWLFYILSELLPVTLVFLTVVLLNVHLTAGMWNSIILYAQIMDFIGTSSFQSFELPRAVSVFTSIHRFIYGSFNLDFFKFEDVLSFCLWDGATVMDVLVFRYLTAVYALLLLLLLLLSFKGPCWDKCQRAWEKGQAAIRRSHHRDLVIHGISAFLVLAYAFCVKVSFQLLSAVYLQGKGHVQVQLVVTLSGNIDYFGKEHIQYALPAILVLILTTLPPVILIAYPNGLQAITTCLGEQSVEKIDEYCSGPKCNFIQRTVRISRFKPVFDSFQGCFKDKCRFFTGMFFLYRFLVSLISALATDVITFHVTLEILIIFMLTFHALTQPYQRPLYNFLDTFMFADLAVVNGLSLLNDYGSSPSVGNRATIASVFQLILIYLPLVFIMILWVMFGVTGCSKKARITLRKVNKHVPLFKETAEEMEEAANNVAETPFDQEHLPHRMFEVSVDGQEENLS